MRPNQIAEIVERQTKLAQGCLEHKQTLTESKVILKPSLSAH